MYLIFCRKDNNMDEITIVTAFFDIGREKFGVFPRANDEYFEYFDFWARIQNPVVVYCQNEYKDRILDIREKYGKGGNTTVISVNDIYSIEEEIFNKMKEVEKNKDFLNFRFCKNACSNIASYNYVMLMKYFFLQDAVSRGLTNTKIAWLDFGYNHGGAKLDNPSDFDFKWNYSFDDKINVFCLSDPDKISSIDTLQFQADCMIGHTIVLPAYKSKDLYSYVKEAIYSLLCLDCMDDDQQLLLMAYKRHKSDFTVRICDWFEDFILYTNHKFSVVTKKDEVIEEKKSGLLFKHILKKQEKDISKQSDFLDRCNNRMNLYGRR